MANVQNSNMVVFLGGYDAEMLAIADACREAGVAVCDKHLGWGAAPSCFLKTGEFVDTCQKTQQEIIGLKLNPPNQPYNWCGGNRYEELSLLWA